jgi:hypothetical protein
MNTIIKPTVGRQVWFEAVNAAAYPLDMVVHGDQPMAATIVYVHNDRLVNVEVLDHEAGRHKFFGVQLLQPGDEKGDGFWVQWMPYQLGQAAKAAPLTAAGMWLNQPQPVNFAGAAPAPVFVPFAAADCRPGCPVCIEIAKADALDAARPALVPTSQVNG